MRWGWDSISPDGEGPKFERPLREEWEIRALTVPDPYVHLRYVMDAVSQIRRTLDNRVPLIGFSGSPFTLACYMVEGCGGTDFRQIKTMLYQRPDLLHHILNITAQAAIAYLNAQIESGAQAVMIFDTWGGALSHAAYREFSLRYISHILAGLKRGMAVSACPTSFYKGWRARAGEHWRIAVAMRVGLDGRGLPKHADELAQGCLARKSRPQQCYFRHRK